MGHVNRVRGIVLVRTFAMVSWDEVTGMRGVIFYNMPKISSGMFFRRAHG